MSLGYSSKKAFNNIFLSSFKKTFPELNSRNVFLRSNCLWNAFFDLSPRFFFCKNFKTFFQKIFFFRLLKMYTRAILSNTRRVAAQQSVRNAVSFHIFNYGISTLHFFLKIQFILGNSNRRGML